MTERQKCATPICPATARRTVMQDRYCEACAASVEQAAYFQTLPAPAAEAVWYRYAMSTKAPEGVTLPEPLGMPAGDVAGRRSGWRSRR